jgi:hypothetical protein
MKMSYQQAPDELVEVVKKWIRDISAGKRRGKEYLSNGGFGEENSRRILDYCMTNFHVINFETLDKTLNLLARGNRLVGFETELGSQDISTPAPSRGSIGLEAAGSIHDIIAKVMNARVVADTASDAEQTVRHAGYKPLPNRELTASEMKSADPRALRAWLARKRGSDFTKIQD